MEEYPLYIDGKNSGKMLVYKDGLMTVFDARCDESDKMIKLFVFGHGESKLLGTMRPQGKGQTIVKKISRSERNLFPKRIEYAADRELKSEKTHLWVSSANGCLLSADGEPNLIAIPADSTKLKMLRDKLRIINGHEYIIFPGKRKS